MFSFWLNRDPDAEIGSAFWLFSVALVQCWRLVRRRRSPTQPLAAGGGMMLVCWLQPCPDSAVYGTFPSAHCMHTGLFRGNRLQPMSNLFAGELVQGSGNVPNGPLASADGHINGRLAVSNACKCVSILSAGELVLGTFTSFYVQDCCCKLLHLCVAPGRRRAGVGRHGRVSLCGRPHLGARHPPRVLGVQDGCGQRAGRCGGVRRRLPRHCGHR